MRDLQWNFYYVYPTARDFKSNSDSHAQLITYLLFDFYYVCASIFVSFSHSLNFTFYTCCFSSYNLLLFLLDFCFGYLLTTKFCLLPWRRSISITSILFFILKQIFHQFINMLNVGHLVLPFWNVVIIPFTFSVNFSDIVMYPCLSFSLCVMYCNLLYHFHIIPRHLQTGLDINKKSSSKYTYSVILPVRKYRFFCQMYFNV